jgi:hypothetical protein
MNQIAALTLPFTQTDKRIGDAAQACVPLDQLGGGHVAAPGVGFTLLEQVTDRVGMASRQQSVAEIRGRRYRPVVGAPRSGRLTLAPQESRP